MIPVSHYLCARTFTLCTLLTIPPSRYWVFTTRTLPVVDKARIQHVLETSRLHAEVSRSTPRAEGQITASLLHEYCDRYLRWSDNTGSYAPLPILVAETLMPRALTSSLKGSGKSSTYCNTGPWRIHNAVVYKVGPSAARSPVHFIMAPTLDTNNDGGVPDGEPDSLNYTGSLMQRAVLATHCILCIVTFGENCLPV